MSKQLKLGRKGRRRLLGATAGLIVLGAAMFVPLTIADAASMVGTPAKTKDVIESSKRTTTPGVRAAHGLPTPGAHGPAFPQTPTSNGPADPKVTGGVIASSADFPSVVGIQSFYWDDVAQTWFVITCTGTVLSPTKVLTAGHCIVDLPFGTTFVIAGRDNLGNTGSGFVARVSSTWTHQSFNYAQLNTQVPHDDLSVLTLRDALPGTYPPVTLATGADSGLYAADQGVTVVGYGVTAQGAGDVGVLHKATNLKIKNDTDCTAALPTGFDTTKMFCTTSTPTGSDACGGDSGGPLYNGTKQIGITDWGVPPCGSSFGVYEDVSFYNGDITADLTRPSLINLDWTGDGHSDLFARRPNGDLIQFTGSGLASDGHGGFSGASLDGTGWQIYTKMFRVTNWNADGKPGIMGKDAAGNLFLYKGDGEGFFQPGPRIQVGNGWNMFSDIMVVNNWTGDGRPNLMGRTPNGDLYLYTSDGMGGWLNNGTGIKIGTGWNMFNTVLTPGPWKGDGFQSLIGRTPSGTLLLYTSDGAGSWQNGGQPILIGTGWSMFSTFMSPGDWNGDNMIDLIGVQPSGVVRLYTTDGHGNWIDATGQVITSGFNQFSAIF